ncbi:hypothetical protein HYH03_010232 [Edaphochlamys debaryana]|uniref:Guanylate cyclase domain-containing protein n=1 Tax=Edaphochlamys debaryana TaxID=47281 RepID=A0A835XWF3_9CHLO|nr:hypothetical protein HYH03_010232 [Edaphochlamys debaryana]|eukprot:KAG2491446.1 hypothetical protein HYH03_010232 [Edaphochlamys debaryana]
MAQPCYETIARLFERRAELGGNGSATPGVKLDLSRALQSGLRNLTKENDLEVLLLGQGETAATPLLRLKADNNTRELEELERQTAAGQPLPSAYLSVPPSRAGGPTVVPLVLLYRRDWWETLVAQQPSFLARSALGSGPRSLPSTWNDMAQLFQSLVNRDFDNDGREDHVLCADLMPGCKGWGLLSAIFSSLVQTQGSRQGVWVDLRNNNTPTVGSPAMSEALRLYARLAAHNVGIFTPNATRDNVPVTESELSTVEDNADADPPVCGVVNPLFIAGRCLFTIDWAISTLFMTQGEAPIVAGRIGAALLPGSTRGLSVATGTMAECTRDTCPHATALRPSVQASQAPAGSPATPATPLIGGLGGRRLQQSPSDGPGGGSSGAFPTDFGGEGDDGDVEHLGLGSVRALLQQTTEPQPPLPATVAQPPIQVPGAPSGLAAPPVPASYGSAAPEPVDSSGAPAGAPDMSHERFLNAAPFVSEMTYVWKVRPDMDNQTARDVQLYMEAIGLAMNLRYNQLVTRPVAGFEDSSSALFGDVCSTLSASGSTTSSRTGANGQYTIFNSTALAVAINALLDLNPSDIEAIVPALRTALLNNNTAFDMTAPYATSYRQVMDDLAVEAVRLYAAAGALSPNASGSASPETVQAADSVLWSDSALGSPLDEAARTANVRFVEIQREFPYPTIWRALYINTFPAESEIPADGPTDRSLALGLGIGLSVGCALLLAALAVVGALFWLRRRKKRYAAKPPGPGPATTLALTDIQNSTLLWETLPPGVMDVCLSTHHRVMRTAIGDNRGYECFTEGDAFAVAFHSPEDALGFAMDLQAGLMAADWPRELLAQQDGLELWVRSASPEEPFEEPAPPQLLPPLGALGGLPAAAATTDGASAADAGTLVAPAAAYAVPPLREAQSELLRPAGGSVQMLAVPPTRSASEPAAALPAARPEPPAQPDALAPPRAVAVLSPAGSNCLDAIPVGQGPVQATAHTNASSTGADAHATASPGANGRSGGVAGVSAHGPPTLGLTLEPMASPAVLAAADALDHGDEGASSSCGDTNSCAGFADPEPAVGTAQEGGSVSGFGGIARRRPTVQIPASLAKTASAGDARAGDQPFGNVSAPVTGLGTPPGGNFEASSAANRRRRIAKLPDTDAAEDWKALVTWDPTDALQAPASPLSRRHSVSRFRAVSQFALDEPGSMQRRAGADGDLNTQEEGDEGRGAPPQPRAPLRLSQSTITPGSPVTERRGGGRSGSVRLGVHRGVSTLEGPRAKQAREGVLQERERTSRLSHGGKGAARTESPKRQHVDAEAGALGLPLGLGRALTGARPVPPSGKPIGLPPDGVKRRMTMFARSAVSRMFPGASANSAPARMDPAKPRPGRMRLGGPSQDEAFDELWHSINVAAGIGPLGPAAAALTTAAGAAGANGEALPAAADQVPVAAGQVLPAEQGSVVPVDTVGSVLRRLFAACAAGGGGAAAQAAGAAEGGDGGKRGPLLVLRGLRVRVGMSSGLQASEMVTEMRNGMPHISYTGEILATAKEIGDAAVGGVVLLSESTFAVYQQTRREAKTVVKLGSGGGGDGRSSSSHGTHLSLMLLHLGEHLPDKGGGGPPASPSGAQAAAPRPLYGAVSPGLAPRLALVQPWVRNHRELVPGCLSAPAGMVAPVFCNVLGIESLLAWERIALERAQRLASGTSGASSGPSKLGAVGLEEDAAGGAFVREGLALFCDIAQQMASRHGGYVVASSSDGGHWVLVFASPEQAVLWGLDMLDAMLTADWPDGFLDHELTEEIYKDDVLVKRGLRLRIGIDYGRAMVRLVPRTGRLDYVGRPMNRAARIAAKAKAATCLASGAAWAAARPALQARVSAQGLGTLPLKGVIEPMELWTLASLQHGTDAMALGAGSSRAG